MNFRTQTEYDDIAGHYEQRLIADDREPGGYDLCSMLQQAEKRHDFVAAQLARMGIGEEGDEPEV